MEPARERILPIIRILEKQFPAPRTALRFENPLQLLVATILSAQARDSRINELTPGLFAKYPTAEAFAEADREELERDIRPSGFFRNKAKAILGATGTIVRDFGGRVPDTMAELVTLPGVARKTANIVLSSAFGKAEGIAVDVHVARLSQRLGLSKEKDPVKIERDLMALVPKRCWLTFNYLLVNHGRAVCVSQKPRCPVCKLQALCPSAKGFLKKLWSKR